MTVSIQPAAQVSALAAQLGICRHCGTVTTDLILDSGHRVCADRETCFANADARHALRPKTEWTAAGRLHGVLSDIICAAMAYDRARIAMTYVAALVRHDAVLPDRERDATECLCEHLASRPRCDGPDHLAGALIRTDLVHDIARDAVVRHVAAEIVQALRAGATLERAVRRPVASSEVYAGAVAAGLSAGWSPWACAMAAAQVLVERATTGLPVVYLRAGRLAAAYPGHDSRSRHVSVEPDGTVWVLRPHAAEWERA